MVRVRPPRVKNSETGAKQRYQEGDDVHSRFVHSGQIVADSIWYLWLAASVVNLLIAEVLTVVDMVIGRRQLF